MSVLSAKKEKLVIQKNPNYSKEEADYHLNEHEKASLSFEAMIDQQMHNNLIAHVFHFFVNVYVSFHTYELIMFSL